MALRAVTEHPKFARLKMLLGLNKSETLGYLECMWHFAGRFTPQGNIGKYTDAEIEGWVEWAGESGALVAALVAARWLEPSNEYRLIIHGWHDHADHATKLCLKRAHLDFVTTVLGQCSDSVRTPFEQCSDSVSTVYAGTEQNGTEQNGREDPPKPPLSPKRRMRRDTVPRDPREPTSHIMTAEELARLCQ